jgi:hypothetical protein
MTIDLENDPVFDKFKDTVNDIMINKIVFEFRKQNGLVTEHLKTGLGLPNFRLSYAKGKWGSWNASENLMTFSIHLFRKFHWSAFVKVLKHEMAHMIVSEIFVKQDGLDDCGKHHGELFKKACNILDLEYSRCDSCTSLAEYEVPEKERIVSRVQKLMALGDDTRGGSDEETKSALSKAYELMEQYNIHSVETDRTERDFIVRPVGSRWKKVPTYVKVLSHTISEYYFVKYIFCGSSGQYSKGRYIEFFGESQNLDIAEYVFHYLLTEGERQWKKFQKTETYKNRKFNAETTWTGRCRPTYTKSAFLEGLYRGYESHLSETKESIAKGHEDELNDMADSKRFLPIGVDDPLLKENYRKQYPNACTWHSSGGSNGEGHGDGYAAGKKIRVRQGVHGSGSRGRLLS